MTLLTAPPEIRREYPRTEIALQKFYTVKTRMSVAEALRVDVAAHVGDTAEYLDQFRKDARVAYMLDTNLPWADCCVMSMVALRQIVGDWRNKNAPKQRAAPPRGNRLLSRTEVLRRASVRHSQRMRRGDADPVRNGSSADQKHPKEVAGR
jgi:hypothetical protein